MRPWSGGVDPHGSRDGTLRRRNRDTPSPLGAEAPLLGRAATLIEAGESHETQGHQRVVHKAFVCEQEFNMTAVSRGAWLSMAYLTLLASLAIAIIWTVVQLRTEMNYLSWLLLSVFYPLGSMAGAQRDHLMFMIRQGCDVEISIRSGTNNEFLVEAMVTLLRRVATRAKAELSVERVDETKSEGDNSAWRPLLRPWNLDTFLRLTRGDQTIVLEVSVAS